MIERPKPGDRVRLITSDFEPDYRAGDAGTVERGPHLIPSGGYYYLVRMERDGLDAAATIIREDEIEVVTPMVASL
jgi:hypothetical protein